MPRLRMTAAQQAIFDDLSDYMEGARMINAAQLARYWGRDVRCVRDWLAANGLTSYRMGHVINFMLRDVARAMAESAA